jgi:hypothetical protein
MSALGRVSRAQHRGRVRPASEVRKGLGIRIAQVLPQRADASASAKSQKAGH